MLLLDSVFVSGIYLLYRPENARFRRFDVAIRSKSELNLMPHEICPRSLLEEAGGRLKYDGVGKHYYASGGLNVISAAAQFH